MYFHKEYMFNNSYSFTLWSGLIAIDGLPRNNFSLILIINNISIHVTFKGPCPKA